MPDQIDPRAYVIAKKILLQDESLSNDETTWYRFNDRLVNQIIYRWESRYGQF